MKKLLIFLFVLAGFAAKSQYIPMTSYGYKYKRIKPDTVLHIPVINDSLLYTTDTSAQIRVIGNNIYWHYGYWRTFVTGSGFDTSILRGVYMDTAFAINDSTTRYCKGTTCWDITIHGTGSSFDTSILRGVYMDTAFAINDSTTRYCKGNTCWNVVIRGDSSARIDTIFSFTTDSIIVNKKLRIPLTDTTHAKKGCGNLIYDTINEHYYGDVCINGVHNYWGCFDCLNEDLTAGIGFVPVPNYNGTVARTFDVDTATLATISYVNQFFNTSGGITYFVDSIACDDAAFSEGASVLVCANGATGLFTDWEDSIGTLTGGIWNFQAATVGQLLAVTNETQSAIYKLTDTGWLLISNAFLVGGNQLGIPLKLGSVDNKDLIFITHDTIRGRIDTAGDWFINNLANVGDTHVAADAQGKLYNVPDTALNVHSPLYYNATRDSLFVDTTGFGTGTVIDVTATSPITSSGGTTPNISTSMNTNKLIGRYSAGTGVMQEVNISTGLALDGSGNLTATGLAAVPTWQQTLVAGSTMTQNNTIIGAATNFSWTGFANINISTTNRFNFLATNTATINSLDSTYILASNDLEMASVAIHSRATTSNVWGYTTTQLLTANTSGLFRTGSVFSYDNKNKVVIIDTTTGAYNHSTLDSNLVIGLHTENYYNTKYVYTASNGITLTAKNFTWGGTLAANTTITGAGFYSAFSGGRLEAGQGAAVTAANNLTLGGDGNTFSITGATQINAITTANWQAGSVVNLVFASTPTVKHNTAGGAGTAVILLSNSTDFTAAANDVLTLLYDGTVWHEAARKQATVAGAFWALASGGTLTAANTITFNTEKWLRFTGTVTGTTAPNWLIKWDHTYTGESTVRLSNDSAVVRAYEFAPTITAGANNQRLSGVYMHGTYNINSKTSTTQSVLRISNDNVSTVNQLVLQGNTNPDNVTTFFVDNTGALSIAASNSADIGTNSAKGRFAGGNFYSNNTSVATSSFSTAQAGGNTTTRAGLLFAGASTIQWRMALLDGSTGTIGVGNSSATFVIGAQGFNSAASGTHVLIAGQVIRPLTVTSGGATVTNTASLYLEGASTATVSGANYTLWSDDGLNRFDGRVLNAKGANVTAAGDLTLGTDGNTFTITGTTTINAITTANWTAGSVIRLIFSSTPTVKNNTAGGAGTAVMFLSGGADFSATANDVLVLLYDGTEWLEQSRSVN